jgi:hypothetical protein
MIKEEQSAADLSKSFLSATVISGINPNNTMNNTAHKLEVNSSICTEPHNQTDFKVGFQELDGNIISAAQS